MGFLLGAACVACVALSIGLVWTARNLRRLKHRFAAVVDIDAERARVQREIAELQRAQASREQEGAARLAQRETQVAAEEAAATQRLAMREQEGAARLAQREAQVAAEEAAAGARMSTLRRDYDRDHAIYARLKHEINLLEEHAGDLAVGLYRPSHAFDTPEQYKIALDQVWTEQKAMVKADTATACPHAWTINGSTVEGRRMQKQLAKLMLRAFNAEVDAAVARVAWNNATRMEERVQKAYEGINALGTVIGVSITPAYLRLALRELTLTFEYEQKKQAVIEEQREIRERLREEEKALRDAARAQEEAEKEEQRYAKALVKAQKDLARARGAEVDELTQRIAQLEIALGEAHAQKARAKSMAELTKSGYVYIISNVGSFGEDVFKIGMTRRLDPMDRVRELGDASVPFEFDVHAMVYCDDAPRLENELHRRFSQGRVNLLNNRKEFFSVPIHEIAGFVKDRGLSLELTLLAEAREYRQTVALREQTKNNGHFLFHWFTAGPFQAHLQAHKNPGSTVDRILLSQFPAYPVLAPPPELVARFEAVAAPMQARINAANAEASTLADLREILLPKLRSGELRIRDAEKAVEAVL